MAINLLLLCLLSVASPAVSSNSVVSELATLQSNSENGVIHLTDALLRRILSLPAPRPFHFIIFFDAQKLHSKTELSLSTLKREYSVVSHSFLSNNPDKKSLLFFFEIEYEESAASFHLCGVESLPDLRLIPPPAADPKTESIKMEAKGFARLADSMAEFVESKTEFSVLPIVRPPILSKTQMAFLIAVALFWAPFIVKKLVSGKTIFHDKRMWMVGAIVVYFLSVAGTMFNIIRKVPMFLVDRETMVFFYRSPGTQLGAEGVSIGFLFTIVGLLLAFLVHVVVRVRETKVQRLMMYFALFVSFWAVKMVIILSNWKTGYALRVYWPNRWR